MCAKQRIALYGGTFDPVHLGHLEVARRVQELFEIKKLLFVPAQVAPHKVGKLVSAPLHRHAMLALASQDDPTLAISTFELESPDRSYTIDTLTHFVSEFGETADLFFIMGADSWSEITTWREWERLLRVVNHIVVTRPGYEIEDYPTVRDRIVDLRVSKLQALLPEGPRIFITDVVLKDISASQIRRLASAGRYSELTGLVSKPVATYIEKYRIYQESNERKFNC
ncbi:MAG: nicotinate (nicotinamide) nucleotide adenylyltransferase [Acidobacteria bacterium]|nr:MAG: nicotinate (nicotinamide) nucleotide adenylyltransferase [Acidobacteriota bacterium]